MLDAGCWMLDAGCWMPDAGSACRCPRTPARPRDTPIPFIKKESAWKERRGTGRVAETCPATQGGLEACACPGIGKYPHRPMALAAPIGGRVGKRTVWEAGMSQNIAASRASKSPTWLPRTLKAVGAIAIVVVAVGAIFRVTPWPGAMIIRAVFEKDSAKVKKALEAHQPRIPIAVAANEQYKSGDGDALLDAYYPESAQGRLPVVIWTHGGAWISGHKDDAAPYFKLIAAEGYTVISLGYSLAPGRKYATPIHQLNEAYAYIQQNADRLHADTSKIFLAGDSAGSQISSQMATLITSPSYASEVGITPNLKPRAAQGCDPVVRHLPDGQAGESRSHLAENRRMGRRYYGMGLFRYRDFSDPVIKQMSPYYHVTPDFPPAFISGGNADPLTDVQSKALAEKLQSQGGTVDTLFFAPDHQPQLPHEYQFNLDNEDGKTALARMLQFLKAHAQ